MKVAGCTTLYHYVPMTLGSALPIATRLL